LTPTEFVAKMLLLQPNCMCYSNELFKFLYETKHRSGVLKNSCICKYGNSYIAVFKNSYERFWISKSL